MAVQQRRRGPALFVWLGLTALLPGCSGDPTTVYSKDRCGGLPAWSHPGVENGELVSLNRITLRGQTLIWNGYPVTSWEVRNLIQEVEKMPAPPALVLEIGEGQDCGSVARARDMLTRSVQCSHYHGCAEYSEKEWDKSHPTRPTP